jgi:hypothetical protein
VNIDPNEVFAFVRTTQDGALLKEVVSKASERLEHLQKVYDFKASGDPNVQPSDEVHGGPFGTPMAGPGPADAAGAADIFAQRDINQRIEKDREESNVGLEPVGVNVGLLDEGKAKANREAIEKHAEQQSERRRKAVQAGAEGKSAAGHESGAGVSAGPSATAAGAHHRK